MHIYGQRDFTIYCKSAWAVAGVTVIEIVVAGITNLDNLRMHSDEGCRIYQSRHSLSVSPAKLRAARRNNRPPSMLARVPARYGIRQAMTGCQRRRAFLVMRFATHFARCGIYNLSSEFLELILQTQKFVTSGRLALF